jgi:hypothetical protein
VRSSRVVGEGCRAAELGVRSSGRGLGGGLELERHLGEAVRRCILGGGGEEDLGQRMQEEEHGRAVGRPTAGAPCCHQGRRVVLHWEAVDRGARAPRCHWGERSRAACEAVEGGVAAAEKEGREAPPPKKKKGGRGRQRESSSGRRGMHGCSEHGPICHLFELILVIHANTSNGTNHII